jgi:hypothetical protein
MNDPRAQDRTGYEGVRMPELLAAKSDLYAQLIAANRSGDRSTGQSLRARIRQLNRELSIRESLRRQDT